MKLFFDVQPYFDPTRRRKMAKDDDPKKTETKIEEDLKKMKMEDGLKKK